MLERVGRKIEEEVLDKYKVENIKREAYRGRRRLKGSKKYKIRKW